MENKASSPRRTPRITPERSRGDLKIISSPVSSRAQSRATYLLLCPLYSQRAPVAATAVPALVSAGARWQEEEEREEDGWQARCCTSSAPLASEPLQMMLKASRCKASSSPHSSKAERILDAIARTEHRTCFLSCCFALGQVHISPSSVISMGRSGEVHNSSFLLPKACHPRPAWLALLGQKPSMGSALFSTPVGSSFIHIPFGLKLQAVSSLHSSQILDASAG